MMKKFFCFLLFTMFGMTSGLAADCTATGQKVAAEQGGKLTKSTPLVENGREVCVVIVFVPGRNGEKPRRVEVAVPAR